MKKFTKAILPFLFIALLVSAKFSNAQSPSWMWAKSAATNANGTNGGSSLCVDQSGNVYVTGHFNTNTIVFGAFTFTNANTNGSEDIFIVKYDALGNVLWAKSSGGTNLDTGIGINTDASGNVYVTGYFQSTSISFSTTTLTNTAFSTNIFVVKYDASGNLVWAKTTSGGNAVRGRSISSDASGNVYVTGEFGTSTLTVGTSTLTSSGILDILVIKYDVAGNVLWAKGAGGSQNDYGNGISVDGTGNVFVTGYFISNSITCGTNTLTNSGANDLFLIQYDASGNVQWAKRAGGSGNDVSNSVSAESGGNAYITGSFESTISIGTTTLVNAGFAGSTDIFIAKYDGTGNVLWAKSIGANSNDVGYSITTHTSGNVYVTGSFFSFPIVIGTTTLTNSGSDDIFIAKYDGLGNSLWAKGTGGASFDVSTSISVDAAGNAHVTGYFNSNSVPFGGTNLIKTGGNIMLFVAKLDNVITGITNENNSNTEFNIYPNPSNGLFEIGIKENSISSLKITNLLGQIVFQQELNSVKESINLQNLESGVYNLSLILKDKIMFNKKLIIQK